MFLLGRVCLKVSESSVVVNGMTLQKVLTAEFVLRRLWNCFTVGDMVVVKTVNTDKFVVVTWELVGR